MYNVSSTSAALTVFALSFTLSKSSHQVYMNYSIYVNLPPQQLLYCGFCAGVLFDLLINKIILKSLQMTPSLSISFSLLPNKNTNCQGTHSSPDVPNDTSCPHTHTHLPVKYKKVVGMQQISTCSTNKC